MSAPPQTSGEPITDKAQLVAYLEAGCKPRAAWRMGTEHEKFGYNRQDHRPLPYEGNQGIGAILNGLVEQFGWTPIDEDGNTKPTEVFAEGWLHGNAAWGRPVDIQVLPDGSMLVSDDKEGAVYRIDYLGD